MHNREIRLDDVIELMKEKLGSGYDVTFSPKGTSMLPLLKEGRDSVTLTAPPPQLQKYDIIFYRRDSGQYVLHRVVRVGRTYTCMGDHQYVPEKGIRRDQIIAVCSSFIRKGKQVSSNAPKWRMYAIFWHYSRPVRRALNGVRGRIVSMIKG